MFFWVVGGPSETASEVVVPFEEFKKGGYQQAVNELNRLTAQDTLKVDGPQLSETIRSLAVQLRDSICDMPSLHQQIMERFLQTQADAVLQNFSESLGPKPVEYDPEFNIDISGSLKSFEDIVQNLSLGEVAEPLAKRLRTNLEASAGEWRRSNEALGDSIANWREVLRRGCHLLASKRIGARNCGAAQAGSQPVFGFVQCDSLGPASAPSICMCQTTFEF